MEFESQGGIHHMTGEDSSLPHQEPVFGEQIWAVENPGSTSTAFSAAAHPDEDWTKISDLAERRRIQNRIAQRNYRKKIKERMADLEKRAGPEGNNVSDTSGEKWTKSLKKTQQQQSPSPPPEHYWLQYPSPSGVPQHPFMPPMNPEDHFFPSPSLPAISSPPFASYQPTYSLPSDKDMLIQPYESPQQHATSTQDEQAPPLSEPWLPDLKALGQWGIPDSSSPPTGHETTRDIENSMPQLDGPGDVIALRLAEGDSTEPSSGPKRVQRHPGTFQCTLCPKRFTREYNLRSHLRTHTNERPFACTACGKTFARQHDKKRHEGLHSGRKRFVCGGDLNAGGQWGCGRRFSRADALGRHFRSEAGRVCIKPLLNEENLEMQRGKQPLPYESAPVEFRLPAALLAQYPALAGMDRAGDFNAEPDDDRSRYDSSDYESDDAGYTSGTEFGFGDKNGRGQASSYRRSSAADESQVLRPDMIVHGKDVRVKAAAALRSLSDQLSSTNTGTSNKKGQFPDQESVRPKESQNQIPPLSHRSEGEDLDEPEKRIQAITDSQQSDDDMSLRSFTESVFDMGSIVSSASSSHNNNHAMVSSFVDILIREPNMDNLLAITTSEFGSSSGRFTRNFSRILKSYSRHLQQAVESSSLVDWDKYLIAAKSVRSARHQVSNLIASRYNERAPTAQDFKHREVELISRHLNQPMTTDIEDPSSNEESSEDEVDLMMGDLKQFLVSGEPFRLLKRNLRSLVIPDEFLYYIYESVREFLDLVLADTRPRSFARGLLRAIANGQDISSNLNLQIRFMAEEVKAECKDISQLDASIFLETYSQYISVVAIDQVKDSFITPGRSAQGSSAIPERGSDQKNALLSTKRHVEHEPKPTIPHEDVLEQVVADTLPSVLYVDLVPHREFLAGSVAFASFIKSLHDLVYPNFVSEATRSVKAIIRSAEKSEDRQLALEGQRMLPILSEMQCCLQQNNSRMSFSTAQEKTHVTTLDKLKLAIETSTAAEWDWWPLQPPSRSHNPGRARISWRCSCGVQRHETTSLYYASKLESIFNKFPLAPGDRSGSADKPARSLSNASSQGARSTQSAESSSTHTGGEQSASSLASSITSAITAPDDGDDSVVDFGAGRRRYIYIFLLVKASEYTLDTIDVSSMKARDLFQALRSTYNKHRGLWRRAFSVFVYHHCDFIKIIKPEPDTFMPGELKFELPSDHDDEYQYRPRPTYSAPITKHMFRHYFYGCYDSSSLWHRLHACNPLTARCRIRNPAAELLDHFPKRDRPVAAAAQSEKVEVCYGLAARECRSFFRVLVYLCVIMAPAVWFVFAWIFMWGNQGDLQDATVPMTLVLAMLSILWAVVYSGSDVRKDYGDALN